MMALVAEQGVHGQVAGGFSYLELVIVIALIGTLVAVALHKMLPLVAEAERVAVMRTESQLRSALMLAAARRIARGESVSIAELEQSNPMALLLETPASYLGERSRREASAVPARHWFFDPERRRLVYQAGRGFPPPHETGGPVRLEYSVRVAFDDGNGDGRYEPGPDVLHGVRLMRVGGVETKLSVATQ